MPTIFNPLFQILMVSISRKAIKAVVLFFITCIQSKTLPVYQSQCVPAIKQYVMLYPLFQVVSRMSVVTHTVAYMYTVFLFYGNFLSAFIQCTIQITVILIKATYCIYQCIRMPNTQSQ